MPEQNSEMGAYLAKLLEQRARLDIIIADVQREMGVAEGGEAPVGAVLSIAPRGAVQRGRIAPDEFFGLSIPEAVKKYLAIMKQPQSPKAMVEGLQAGGLLTNAKNFYPNVTTALKRLRLAEQVVLTPNGWGLTAWYPNRPKSADEGKRGRRGKGKRGPKGPGKRQTKAAKVTPATKASADAGTNGKHKPKSGYLVFVADQMKGGKTMAEAAAEWRKQKAAS
jgi:hypothetical protein